MGLITNIEKWGMPAAIGMATEGIKAKYSQGVGGGGFGAADMEIASRIDGAKVLAVIDEIEKVSPHLADWSLFAYSSPYWNAQENRQRLFSHLLHDWAMKLAGNGVFIQERTFRRVETLVPLIAGGLALEQTSGADVSYHNSKLQYQPVTTRSALIAALVEFDCKEKDDFSESIWKKRQRYYQNHWSAWQQHVESIRAQLISYDQLARTLFKKALENKSGAY